MLPRLHGSTWAQKEEACGIWGLVLHLWTLTSPTSWPSRWLGQREPQARVRGGGGVSHSPARETPCDDKHKEGTHYTCVRGLDGL